MYYNSRTNQIKRFFSDLLEAENATNDPDRVKQLAFDVEDILDELEESVNESLPTQEELDDAVGSYGSYLRWKNEA